MPFQVYQDTIFGEEISREGVQPDPRRLFTLTNMPLLTEGNTILFGIMNYLGKFSPSTAEECKPLRKFRSSKYK